MPAKATLVVGVLLAVLVPPARPRLAARRAPAPGDRPHRGGALGLAGRAPCASWPARPADRYTGPWTASTRNPVLLVGTRFDPNTPLVDARIAERRLGSAVLLTHDGYGHLSSADPSTCVVQATGRHLVDLTTPARGTVCPSDRLPFDPDFGVRRSP
jgi:hypothetical protein